MRRLVRFALALLLPIAAAEQNVSIRREGGAFKVIGWEPGASVPAGEWPSLFAVYAGGGDVLPMLGSYSVENGSLVFRPRFPLAPAVRTHAVFHAPGASKIEAVFEPAEGAASASTRVQNVYPSSDLLPANQLKFYLLFSAPMRRGEAWKHIHLLDENGSRVELPFLELDQELWDRDYERLTVLFDPGRIKRGVLPLEEAGPAIEEGKQYTLIIDPEWRDARGVSLQQEFRKRFRVGSAARAPLDPTQWRIVPPEAGASNPLLVELPNPMDYALLLRLLDVSGEMGRVDGTITIGRNETEWRFVPRRPWKQGSYRLEIDTAIEDLAGNRIGRAFDVDVFDPVTVRMARKTISLPFRISR